MKAQPSQWVSTLFIKELEESAYLFCENCDNPCARAECPIDTLGGCLPFIMSKGEMKSFLDYLDSDSHSFSHDACIDRMMARLKVKAVAHLIPSSVDLTDLNK